ncbi:type II secretion system ATPase GspE [Chromobacterium subtsugae]|uniref:Type II secretion system protein E n=1 Tax=Chromobacterium subtsugae TaxID=251747 RepID=A0ABS7FGH8_9NEIS|nr:MULTISPECIES: type II secretion system ATPase GspE [Chromobacterium]KUM00008.1 type II secretion system protein GspE [Chromobacterium subtsugae]KZE86320.1 type II secretion system protein GspE [Chromobacterium sp. F49]MBW7567942.1 type II secretion system ATPase GspE [Chromobacterium subtsugae]MBW8289169.1 type II secretion system ATPase GspE [Chromobacterium subtsugae]OBU86427.1 general secretion pathway protein GspE [Chromobacterium subtsugae]
MNKPTLMPLLAFPFARANGVILLDGESGRQLLLREDARPAAWAEALRLHGGTLVGVETLTQAQFEKRLSEHYASRDGAAAEMVDDIGQDMDLNQMVESLPTVEDLLESEGDAPIIRMINALLTQALRDGASDIHIEAFEDRSVVRFRLDGTLRDVVSPHRALHAAMVSRIKIMSGMDIAEKRIPQDGRISLRLGGRPVDVRVSTLPTSHGERVVLRLLDKENARLDLATLGMAADTLASVDKLINQPHGILLVTGPTGSGKTTTLYAALSRLDASHTNIMTVEDPVEYHLDGVGQTQVNPKIDMSFAKALRAILRQDPDVVMIGEIRDLETAQIAVQASLTGHLVLATLHTNDAASAVTRLTDMGVEPFLLASSLLGVMAQRLVRRVCPQCKAPHPVPLEDEPDAIHYRPVGCPACGNSGYKGRYGVYELMLVDDTMQRLIHDRASEQRLRDHAQRHGMRSLRDDGLRWVKAGETSLEEILRVTRS